MLREKAERPRIRKERCEREANGKDGVCKANLSELAFKSFMENWRCGNNSSKNYCKKKQRNTSKF